MKQRYTAAGHPGVPYQYRYAMTIKEYRIERKEPVNETPWRSGIFKE